MIRSIQKSGWIVAGCILLGFLILAAIRIGKSTEPGETGNTTSASRPIPAAEPSDATRPSRPQGEFEDKANRPDSNEPFLPDQQVFDHGIALMNRLKEGALTLEEARTALDQWRQLVHDADPGQAAAALLAFLETGEDAPTGLAFLVGAEGVLDEAPSLRVAAIDLLGQTNPSQALTASREIAQSNTNPDEFAMALRNVAWLNRNGAEDPFLAAQFRRMLDEDRWLAQPSTGFLEAFDVAVAVGGEPMWVELGSVLRMEDSGDHPANQAAFVALDRLTLREPHVLAGLLLAEPDWLAWAPDHRASLMSRMDVRDANQLRTLERYLPTLAGDPELATYFSSVFPNRNAFSGYRLVTTAEPVAGSTAQDQATLSQIRKWLAESNMQSSRTILRAVEQRLVELLEE